MAIFRKIHVSFWKDEFIESLTPEQKYFYLYLMTNDRTKQCGIYEITFRQICYDTGYNEETVKKLIEYFISCDKIRYSFNTKEIALKNWGKYNDSRSPLVLKCIKDELSRVKDRVLIQYIYSIHTELQEEQEEEQEEEEEQEDNLNISFDDFWNLYDKKRGLRNKVEVKWANLTNLEREQAMAYIPKYKESQPDKTFRKDPTTFINNKAWNDELIIPFSKNPSNRGRQKTPYEIELEQQRQEALKRSQSSVN